MALFVGRLGAVQLSAFVVVSNVGATAFQFSAAFGVAATTLVGNALGAGDPQVCK